MGDNNLNGKKWKEIEKMKIYKRKFLDYVVTVEQLNAIDGNGWNDVFYRLNKNAKTLSRQELRHAQFDGWFINRAEQEVEKDKFWQILKISTLKSKKNEGCRIYFYFTIGNFRGKNCWISAI